MDHEHRHQGPHQRIDEFFHAARLGERLECPVLPGDQGEGLAGQVTFVGFDPSAQLVEAMGNKKIQGLVLQDPVAMGYLGVKTMVEHLEGKEVPRRIPTGEVMATPENMDSPEIKKLLEPDQAD